MQIHVPTLFYLMCGISLLAAGRMALEWQRQRSRSLLWWSFSYLAVAVAGLLSSLRALGFVTVGIGLSNALLIAGYGMIWHAAAQFTGQRAPVPLLLGGVLVWLTAWTFPGFAGNVDLRILLSSMLVAAYSFGTAICFLSSREGLAAARQAGWAFLLHGTIYLARIATLPIFSSPADPLQTSSLPTVIVMFEAVLFIVVTTYLYLAMTRERSEKLLIAEYQFDYLTGVANRRAFTEQARREIAERGTVAALIFDLDHFKQINDRYGHAVGDEILKLFCRVAQTRLTQADLFGRLGGEEFALLLPADSESGARQKALSIIRDFAVAAQEVAGRPVGATVSAGLAIPPQPLELDALLQEADEALYRAKRAGRNGLAVSSSKLGMAAAS